MHSSGELRDKEEEDREMGCTFPKSSTVKCSDGVQHLWGDPVWLRPRMPVENWQRLGSKPTKVLLNKEFETDPPYQRLLSDVPVLIAGCVCFKQIGLPWWLRWPANTGDLSSIPGSGRSPGGGNGNPLQCSCLENPMDRGAWWAAVHGCKESDTNH